LTYSRDRHKQALVEIDALDPDEFDDQESYQDKVAEIWADKDWDVSQYSRENLGAEQTPEESGPSKHPGSEDKDPESGDLWSKVETAAKEHDIDPEDEFFLMTCKNAPGELDGKKLTFDDQLDWAIERTKPYFAGKRQEERNAASDKATGHQKKKAPMARGGEAPARKPSEAKPVSVDDALEFAAEKRRL